MQAASRVLASWGHVTEGACETCCSNATGLLRRFEDHTCNALVIGVRCVCHGVRHRPHEAVPPGWRHWPSEHGCGCFPGAWQCGGQAEEGAGPE